MAGAKLEGGLVGDAGEGEATAESALQERKEHNKELIEALISEGHQRMGLIEFTLRQANGKLEQGAFEKLLIMLRSDLHEMGDRAITDTGGPIRHENLSSASEADRTSSDHGHI